MARVPRLLEFTPLSQVLLAGAQRWLCVREWALFGALIAAGLAPSPALARSPEPVHYELRISDPSRQYIDVRVKVPALRGREVRVAIPAWAPGSYKIRDFGRHISDLRAQGLDGKSLKVEREDKQTWRIEHERQAFHLDYRVFADELSVRTCYVDDTMAVLNGPCVFVYLIEDEPKDRAVTLDIQAPLGWQSHIALPDVAKHPGRHAARNYDALIDAPIIMGHTTQSAFKIGKHTFEYVLLAPSGTNANLKRLVDETERIVQSFDVLMGGLPMQHYEFFMVLDHAKRRGGLEHHDSTAMILPPWGFGSDEGYQGAASLTAHEFYHAWNVKRIRDRVLGPFDYTRENYTDLLWFHEGFTETMRAKALVHSGLKDPQAFLDDLGERYTKYQSLPGRNVETMAQLSKDAWFKQYQSAANHRNTTISYYFKGDLIGVALDLELRLRARRQGRESSLEAMMRRLWSERVDGHRSITQADIRAAASAEAGQDMNWFFDRFVDGRDELSLPELLRAVGVRVRSRRAWQDIDGVDDPDRQSKRAWTGIIGTGTAIDSIDPESPADAAKLMPGDEIIALDGHRVSGLQEVSARIADRQPGDRVAISLFRGGRLYTRSIVVRDDPYTTWSFELPAKLEGKGKTQAQNPALDAWLYRKRE